MNVEIYSCASDNRVVNKALSPIGVYTLTIKNELDILNPNFIVNYDGSSATIVQNLMGFANYCYIPDLGRYYYITNKKLITAKRFEFECSIDVLMTYSAGIRAAAATIVRNEKVGINDIVDDKLPVLNKKDLALIEFSQSAFNTGSASSGTYNFVLNVAGGGNSAGTVAENEVI